MPILWCICIVNIDLVRGYCTRMLIFTIWLYGVQWILVFSPSAMKTVIAKIGRYISATMSIRLCRFSLGPRVGRTEMCVVVLPCVCRILMLQTARGSGWGVNLGVFSVSYIITVETQGVQGTILYTLLMIAIETCMSTIGRVALSLLWIDLARISMLFRGSFRTASFFFLIESMGTIAGL